MKSCRGIWQVFATNQNSKMFLRLAEQQLSSLSIICVLHRCMYTYVTSELKKHNPEKGFKTKNHDCTHYTLFSTKSSLMDHMFYIRNLSAFLSSSSLQHKTCLIQKSLLYTVRTRPLKITHLLFSSFPNFSPPSHSPPNNSQMETLALANTFSYKTVF